MRIALIQTNPVIGAFAANLAGMTAWLKRAKEAGCGLAIFPELALCGYPPQDLLERPSFLDDHQRALEQLCNQAHGIAIICGILERHTGPTGKPLHNSAALLADGRQVWSSQKRLLPTYDVFDEQRYFEPGAGSRVCTWEGIRLALTVCEDIWNDDDAIDHRLYPVDPVHDLTHTPDGKPDLLINIAASPFHMGKPRQKQALFAGLCRRHTMPLLYVNQVGGQDALLFDGASLAMNAAGVTIRQAAKFREDMAIVTFDHQTGRLTAAESTTTRQDPGDDLTDVLAALVMGTRDYLLKCGFNKVVLGLSGGIDSALTCVIASRALGPRQVLGVALPSQFSSPESVADATALADNLGIDFTIMPIDQVFQAEQEALAPLFADLPPDVTEQNLQARTRGLLLMALANKFNRLLLSTGNKSELAVGYCTLYGDMNGGLAVLADVPKQIVYRLSRHINHRREIIPWRTITKPPSAELAPNQCDQDDLPPYDILDAIVAAYLEENLNSDQIIARGFAAATVRDVISRIKRNEYKRKQAPMGLRVTSKAFGCGRRYPTAEGYMP